MASQIDRWHRVHALFRLFYSTIIDIGFQFVAKATRYRRPYTCFLAASALAAFALSLAVQPCPPQAAGTVNVYSFRQPELLAPLFEKFTADTGIEVKTLFADKGLIERMEQEGALSPADVLMTADVGPPRAGAAEKGLAQPLDDETIKSQVPASMRDAGEPVVWPHHAGPRGLCLEASASSRTAISYEELADPKWKGKICTRPGNHPYNLGLIAYRHRAQGQGRRQAMAHRPEGQPRQSSLPAMIANRPKACFPANAISPSPTPITWA